MEINHNSNNENETKTAQIISKKWEDDCNSFLKLDIGNVTPWRKNPRHETKSIKSKKHAVCLHLCECDKMFKYLNPERL